VLLRRKRHERVLHLNVIVVDRARDDTGFISIRRRVIHPHLAVRDPSASSGVFHKACPRAKVPRSAGHTFGNLNARCSPERECLAAGVWKTKNCP
jgi:hypothetical protein